MPQIFGRLVFGKGIRQRLIIAFSFLILLIALIAAIGAWQLFELQGVLADAASATRADPRIAQAVASAESGRNLLLIAGGVAALLGLFCAWQVTVVVTKPLRRAAHIAKQVADGDLRVRLEASEMNETGHLLQALVHMTDRLRSLLAEVTTGVRAVSEASTQITQGNQDLSRRTEHQASTLEETASSMEQLTSTVDHNAQSAREASQLAVTATGVAQKGGDAVEQVLLTMDEILDAAKKIGSITGVIDSIAFQTNILALNAAVEAARAGEQGRGFAVVAGEVRSLAQRSAAAAKEIRTLIADTSQKVQTGSSVADGAGHTMVEVVSTIKKVSELVAEIAAASREQSAGVAQVNIALTQMDQVVQQNAALAEEATSATESMKQQTDRLLQIVSRFKLGDGMERPAPWVPQPGTERTSMRSRLGLGGRDSQWNSLDVQDSEFSEVR